MEKKELTVEELEAECKKISEKYKTVSDQLKKKKQEEEERKQAELALQKEKRMEEIKEVEEKLNELYTDFINDYGSISITRSSSDDSFTPFWRHRFWF